MKEFWMASAAPERIDARRSGTETLLTTSLFKPTLGQLILGAVMLRPGWMRRYVPAESRAG